MLSLKLEYAIKRDPRKILMKLITQELTASLSILLSGTSIKDTVNFKLFMSNCYLTLR